MFIRTLGRGGQRKGQSGGVAVGLALFLCLTPAAGSLCPGQEPGLLSPASDRPGPGAAVPLWRATAGLLPGPEAPQKCTAFLWIFRFAASHPPASQRRWSWMRNGKTPLAAQGFETPLDFLDFTSKIFDPQTAVWTPRQSDVPRPADFPPASRRRNAGKKSGERPLAAQGFQGGQEN